MRLPGVILDRSVDDVVREAIRFIRERTHLREMDFTLEVGEHLFEHVYGGSVQLYRAQHVAKQTTLRKIAKGCRTRVSHNELYECVQTFLMLKKLGREHPRVNRPVLTSDKWKLMWKLYDDSETLLLIADWAARHRAPKALITAAVQTLEPYLAKGGKIEDLLVAPPEDPETPFDRMMRMLTVELGWLREGIQLSDDTRRQALALIDRIERRCL